MQEVILLKFGESFLKGKNRGKFYRKILNQLKQKGFGPFLIENRIIIYQSIDDSSLKILKKVPGIKEIAPAYLYSHEEEAQLIEFLTSILKNIKTYSLKIKRSYKQFPLTSQDFLFYLAKKLPSRLNFKNYEKKIYIEILKDYFVLYFEKIEGFGGIPQDENNKVLILLSSGIDSPVATILLIRRGMIPYFISFYRDEEEKSVITKIYNKIKEYGQVGKLFLKDYRQYIFPHIKDKKEYTCVFCKQTMFLEAYTIMKDYNIKFLATGENLGQVASQTLDNIDFISKPVLKKGINILRPLLTYEKSEIIELSKKYGLFDLSIQYKTPCKYKPKKVVTHAKKWFLFDVIGVLIKKVNGSYYLDDEVYDILKQLRLEYNLGVLSNLSKEKGLELLKNMKLLDYFNFVEFGDKTNPSFFEEILKKLKTYPFLVSFIDDKEINLKAAERVGIRTYYKPSKSSLKEILKYYSIL